MLHVGRLPVCLQGPEVGRRRYGYSGTVSARHWVCDIDTGHVARLLIWRIQADVLQQCSVEHLIMVDSVTHSNRGVAVLKRVPGKTDARSKIVLGSVDNKFAEWRRDRRTVEIRRPGRIVLCVRDNAVTEVLAGRRNAVSGSGNERRLCRIPQLRYEVRKAAVLVVRRSKERVSHSDIERQIWSELPLVLSKSFKGLLPEIGRVVEACLVEGGVGSHQKVRPLL